MKAKNKQERGKRPVQALKVSGWTLIVLALAHTATDIATLLSEPSPQQNAATAAMQQVMIPTSSHSMASFVYGLSFSMALFLAAIGIALLLIARFGAHEPSLIRAMLWLTTALCAVGLIISILLMPLPPIIGLSIAAISAIVGLLSANR